MTKNYSDVTIFMIEDDDIDAMEVKRCFQKLRVANPIKRAVDGIDALEMLSTGQVAAPFIILLDLQMPRMGGIEFLHQIRKDPEYSSSVIFVLTTSKADEDVLNSYKQNIAGYLLKEQSGVQFIDVIAMLERYWKIAKLPVLPNFPPENLL
jgi:CheY-like chemotaxis protein